MKKGEHMVILGNDLEQYLVQILEQSKNGIVISDPNQSTNPVVYVNKAACETFGYARNDFLGRNCSFLQGDDTQQPELKQISEAIQKRESITTTLRNYTKNGQLVYNQFTISPIFDKNKNLKYFLGIQRNVTNEILLKRQNEEMQEDKIANAQYTAIGKLSAGLSHEINTPLTVIQGHLEMLKSSIESIEKNVHNEYMLEDLSLIQNNLNRIKNITESIREVANTENVEIQEINLYRALIMSLRLTHHKAKNTTQIKLQDQLFNLDIDRDHKRFSIQADRSKIEQAFIAIIGNALDQLEVNSITDNSLEIEIREDPKFYELVFQDNGGGIEPHLLNDIFKPFRSNKLHKGLGIGLCMVKKIMDEHNFQINIANENNGAKVSILIPR